MLCYECAFHFKLCRNVDFLGLGAQTGPEAGLQMYDGHQFLVCKSDQGGEDDGLLQRQAKSIDRGTLLPTSRGPSQGFFGLRRKCFRNSVTL